MPFFIAIEALNMRNVVLFFFDDDGIYYRGIMAVTLSLPLMTPRISLVVLVFFASLALVCERLLGMLGIKYVNGKSISKLISFSFFFIGLYLQRHFTSILRVFEGSCSNIFTSVLTTFSTTSFQSLVPSFRHLTIPR